MKTNYFLKRLSMILSFIVLMGYTANACNYTITLADSYGDGWNGGAVTVSVNGTAVITALTIANGYGPLDSAIAVTTGDIISVVYTAGLYSSENSYEIKDALGTIVATQGASGTPGNVTGLVATCPVAIDAGMIAIIVPTYSGTHTVKGVIVNNGLTTLTAANVDWSVDGASQTQVAWSGSLATNATDTVTLGTFAFAVGTHTIVSYSSAPNSGTDGNTANDTTSVTIPFTGVISSFPFTEDFTSGNSYWPLASGSLSDAYVDTAAGNPGAGIFMTGGTSSYWSNYTTVTGAYGNTDHVSTATATVDASTLTNVRFEFDMRQSYTYQGAYGWARVMINGTDYAKDLNGDSTWNATSTNADPFQTLAFDLSAYAGTTFSISIELASKYDATNYGNTYGDDMHIDNIKVYQPAANDLAMSALIGPASGFEMSNAMNIDVMVYNNGTASQSGYDISYSIDGGATFTTQTVASAVAGGDYDTLAFTTPADLSTAGVYNIILAVTNTGDADATNDTILASTENRALPYHDGFDSNVNLEIPSGWSVVNTTGITSAYAYVSTYGGYTSSNNFKLYNYNALSGDLIGVLPGVYSGLANKAMKFWLNGSTSGDLIVGVMDDPNDASTFVTVDTINQTGSIYTQVAISFSSYTGSGMYIAFKHGMSGNYKSFYIDDIDLYEPLPNEMMMLSWDAPMSSIDYASGDVVVSVYNNGINAQTNIPVAYSTDGGTTIVNDTITATVNPGDTLQFTFTTPATFATGLNECGAVVNNGDAVPANDTAFFEMTNFTMPYLNDFENSISQEVPNGWTEVNETGSTLPYVYAYNYNYYAHSGNFILKLYNQSITSGALIAALPYYGGATLSDKWIKFWHKGYIDCDLIVGVMSDVNDTATFVSIDTILPIDVSYHQYVVDFSSYTGTGKYVAFKHGMNGTYRSLYIDDVAFEVAPTAPLFGSNPDSLFTFNNVRYNYADTLVKTFAISNAGIGQLNINMPSLGGVNDTNFVIVDTNTYPKSLGLLESLTFDVKFFGSSIGARTAYIGFTNDTIILNGDVVDPTISSFPYVENFDDQAIDLGWSLRGGNYKWMYDMDQTGSSNTGPMSDVTGGYYIYTEASSGYQGDAASIYTNPIDMSSLSGAQLNFWYHMYGADIDTFSVELAQGGVWIVVDTINGEQQTSSSDPWLLKSVDLSAYSATLIDSVRFMALRGASYAGDIALDNIAFGENMMIDLGADTATCDSLSITLDAGMGATPLTYEWVDVATGTVVGNAQTYEVMMTGVYAVTVVDEGYFTATDTINVLIATKPIPDMSADVAICMGDSTVVTAGPLSSVPSLLFAMYIEGSSNNKGLSVFNATSDTLDLANFRIAQASNGNGWAYYHTFPAGAKLAPKTSWVMVTNQVDPTMYDTSLADEVLGYPSLVHFNGDDARAIEVTADGGTTWSIIDIIGDPDNDPGSGWDVAGVTNATKDHSMIRKASVFAGDTSWTNIAGTDSLGSQYTVYPKNTFAGLHSHVVVIPTTLTYLWSNGETTVGILVKPTMTTTYTVIVDNGNCQETDSVTVTVNPLPVVNLGNDTTIKWTAGSVTLDAGNPNATWAWNSGETTQMVIYDNTNLINGSANVIAVLVTENNCSATDTLVINVMDDVSINGALDNMELNVYPNPTKGQFNMAINGFEGDLTMNIVNLAGQVVYTERINVTPSYINEFDVSTLSTGVYYIKLTTDNGVKVLKLVIQ